MGSRKHKKHRKSEKKEIINDEREEKPLKLVLKVTGGSASRGGTPSSDHNSDPSSISARTDVNLQYQENESYFSEQQSSSVDANIQPSLAIPISVEKHKKLKKKKKKKSAEKEKKHKRHHHHHHHHRHHHNIKKEEGVEEEQNVELLIKDEPIQDMDSSCDQQQSILLENSSGRSAAYRHLPVDELVGASSVGVQSASEISNAEIASNMSPMVTHHTSSLTAKSSKRSTLQILFASLLTSLQKKDLDQFFAWPVSDVIAPGYSTIIQEPMDFSTMKDKIENNLYSNINEFKFDFKLICDNCMIYNRPETVYYKASKRLLHSGMKMMGKEKLLSSVKSLGLTNDLTNEELGLDPPEIIKLEQPDEPMEVDAVSDAPDNVVDTPLNIEVEAAAKESSSDTTVANVPVDLQDIKEEVIEAECDKVNSNESDVVVETIKTVEPVVDETNDREKENEVVKENLPSVAEVISSPKKAKVSLQRCTIAKPDVRDYDNMTAEEILEQAQKAARCAADKLTLRNPNSKIGFLRKKEDGSTSLAIVNPDGCKLPGSQEREVNLGLLIAKLPSGTGSLTTFKEDSRNVAKPVKSLDYGAFSSYAPQYDSAFANLTKDETEMVYSCYGDEVGVQYAESLLNFSQDSDYVMKMVDNLLDIMTGGEHSKTSSMIAEKKRLKLELEKQRNRENDLIDPSVLSPLINVDSVGADKPADTTAFQSKLDKTAEMIEDLQQIQNDRLGKMLPKHFSHIPGASEKELKLADQVQVQLRELTKQVVPGNVVSIDTVRKAMGISPLPVNE